MSLIPVQPTLVLHLSTSHLFLKIKTMEYMPSRRINKCSKMYSNESLETMSLASAAL